MESMKTLTRAAVLSLTGVGLLLTASALVAGLPPSFDCRRASTPTEKAICASPELSDLDGELGQAFSDAIAVAKPDGMKRLRAEQVSWIRARDEACAAQVPCLAESLKARTAELKRSESASQSQTTQTASTRETPPAGPAASTVSSTARATSDSPPPPSSQDSPQDGIVWDTAPRCAGYKAQHYELRKKVDSGNMLAAQDLVHVDVTAELDGCKRQGSIPTTAAPTRPPTEPTNLVQRPDGSQWKTSSPRCAEYLSKHDALRSQVDAGNMLAAQDLTHLDVTAELEGCKTSAAANGTSNHDFQNRMKACNAKASDKRGDERKEFMSACLKEAP